MSEPADGGRWDALWEQLDELPEGRHGEIVDGEICVIPRPGYPHTRVASKLGVLLGPFGEGMDGPGGWVVLDEPYVRFGDQMRVPDLAGWRAEAFRPPGSGPIDLVPAWICEVLSPSTAQTDRADKLPLYGEHGVRHAWLVDPAARTVEVYRREGDLWVVAGVHAGDARIRAEPFDALELDLSLLWPEPETG